MAGKIIADQIEHSTAGSLDTSYVVGGSAKSWVNFNGTGTVATRDSLNVSSITDSGTGLYRPNFASSMANNNFCGTVGVSESGVGGDPRNIFGDGNTTSLFLLITKNGTAVIDYQFISAAINGDLA